MRHGLIAALLSAAATLVNAQSLASAPVRVSGGASTYAAEGVVEAVRQSVVAAQVAGAVTVIAVKAGDAVKAGQLLARIDAQAANAELAAARQEFERQKQLLDKKFISRSAFDLAEARFKTTQAQSGFYTLTAPYAGLVAEVPATQGDMALPGKPLMTVYDPAKMRVTVNVPQEVAARLAANQATSLEIPGLPTDKRVQQATKVTVLPMADAATHTVQVRVDLPGGLAATPGMFARAMLPMSPVAAGSAAEGQRLYVPKQAVFRRAELSLLYVLDAQGKPQLRQIRTGPVSGDEIEVLAGVSANERVALDPQAAARAH